MRWRILIAGHQFDLDTLARLFSDQELTVGVDDDGYHFITGEQFNTAATAQDALHQAAVELPMINGIARATDPAFRPVELAGAVVNEAQPRTRHVLAEDSLEGRSRLTVGDPGAPIPSSLAGRAASNPALLEAVTRLGASRDANWIDLYKIYEVLRDDAGGQPALQQRVGLTKAEVSRFTLTANHPGGSGDLARHARMSTQPPANPMSLEDGRQFIRQLISSW